LFAKVLLQTNIANALSIIRANVLSIRLNFTRTLLIAVAIFTPFYKENSLVDKTVSVSDTTSKIEDDVIFISNIKDDKTILSSDEKGDKLVTISNIGDSEQDASIKLLEI
ncbi:5224_t:CDS:2, partial [Cetraspora pellucida]